MSDQLKRLVYAPRNSDPATKYVSPASYSTSNYSLGNNGLFRAMWVSVTGNVCVIGADDSIGVFNNVPVGLWPIGGKTIIAANDGTNPTTATISTLILEG